MRPRFKVKRPNKRKAPKTPTKKPVTFGNVAKKTIEYGAAGAGMAVASEGVSNIMNSGSNSGPQQIPIVIQQIPAQATSPAQVTPSNEFFDLKILLVVILMFIFLVVLVFLGVLSCTSWKKRTIKNYQRKLEGKPEEKGILILFSIE